MKTELINTIMSLTRCPRVQSNDVNSCCNRCRYKFLGNRICSEQLETEATVTLNMAIDYLSGNITPAAKNRSREQRINTILKSLGISTSVLGYRHLKYAIGLTIENPSILNEITKGLYPAVSEEFNTTPGRVERAMRHAIEAAWLRGDPDAQYAVFGSSVSTMKGKPTNSEFIGCVAEYIRLEEL